MYSSSGGQNCIKQPLELLSEMFLIRRRTEGDVIKKMYIGLHVKYPLLLSDVDEIWIFSTDFRQNPQTSNFTKCVQWEPSYFMRKDGRTDVTMLIVAFRNFANAPKNGSFTPLFIFNPWKFLYSCDSVSRMLTSFPKCVVCSVCVWILSMCHIYIRRAGKSSFIIFKGIHFGHRLFKFKQSNVNWKTSICSYLGTLLKGAYEE